jgi:hypothetical protein
MQGVAEVKPLLPMGRQGVDLNRAVEQVMS